MEPDHAAYGPRLAPWACRPEESRGRQWPEPESRTRTVHQRDRDRVIHSAAFRRLKHKTQVFVYHEGDHYRTRLSHSLEVSQIARSICRALGLNEDLAEALALAHDLGHPPFGHAGEDALAEVLEPWGGFDHNAQTLKILTTLEHRYAGFDGLNLTWETLEGVVKHNGPLTGPLATRAAPAPVTAFSAGFDLRLDSFAGIEAQVTALSDDIAYNNHDVDDGLRAGVIDLDDLRQVPLVDDTVREVLGAHPGLTGQRLVHEVVRRMISAMVEDLLAETRRRLARADPSGADDIRGLDAPVVAFSEAMQEADRALRTFLRERMYRHPRVNRMTERAGQVVRELFALYMADPATMPPEWRAPEDGQAKVARQVGDYIAGMTDRYAFREHHRLTGRDPGTE